MEFSGGRGGRERIDDAFQSLGFADTCRTNDDAVRAQGGCVETHGACGLVNADRHLEVAHGRCGRGLRGGRALLGLSSMHTLRAGGAFGASSWPHVVVGLAPGGVEATAVGEVDARDEDPGACRERCLGDRPCLPVGVDDAGCAFAPKESAPQVV